MAIPWVLRLPVNASATIGASSPAQLGGTAAKRFVALFVFWIFAASQIQAADAGKKAPPNPNAKRDAAKASADAKKDAENRAIESHLAYLKPYLPRVTAADIRDQSIANLRHLYYEAYRVQGISMDEATRKAAAEITLEKAGEFTLKNSLNGKTGIKIGGKPTAFATHLAYLSKYLPNLTSSDVSGKCAEDMRRLYFGLSKRNYG